MIDLHIDDQQSGPFSLEQIQSKLNSGEINGDSLTWHEGLADWQPVASLTGIKMPGPRLSVQPRPPALPKSFPPQALATANVPPANRTALYIAGFTSGLLILVFFVLGVKALYDSIPPTGSKEGFGNSWMLTPVYLFLSALSVSGAIQFINAAQKVAGPICDICHQQVPTIHVSLNQHIGALVLMFHKTISGSFCKRCIGETFWKHTLVTVAFGWWGIFSMCITPVVLVHNVATFVRSRFMESDE